MANQIIHCPAALLVLLRSAVDKMDHGPLRKVRFDTLGDTAGLRSIVVKIGDHRLVSVSASRGPTFVLWLTDEPQPDPDYQPLPLPEDMVIEMIDLLSEAIPTLGMDGHDAMWLAEVLEEAKTAPNRCPIAHAPRNPENDYEKRLVATAATLQSGLAPALARFDAEMRQFRDRALRSGFNATIQWLSAQARIADAVRQEVSDGAVRLTLDPELADWTRMTALLQHIAADRTTLDLAREGSAIFEFGAEHCTHPTLLTRLYRRLDVHGTWMDDECLWRDRPPEPDPDLPSPISAEHVWPSMHAFSPAFDRRMLARCHPLLRAAIAAAEYSRIQPLLRGNRQLCELLFIATLEEKTATPLPLLIPVRRRRAEWTHALKAAAGQQKPDALAELSLSLARDALRFGHRILDELDREYPRMCAALTAHGFEAEQARTIIEYLMSTVLVWMPIREDSTDPIDVAIYNGAGVLYRLGFLDCIQTDHGPYWSAPFIRRLLVSPSA